MVDYALKQKILQFDAETSILRLNKQYRQLDYYQSYGKCPPPTLDVNYLEFVKNMYVEQCPDIWEECYKINKSTYYRTNRLRRKLYWMLSNFQCSFLTFDFSDSTLALSPAYRRILVSRVCNALDCCYIGNIDYGSDDVYVDRHGNMRIGTKREHYHVVVAKYCHSELTPSLADFIANGYGYVYVEHCRGAYKSSLYFSRYVSKLANHAIKETAQRSALLYSRKYKISEMDLPPYLRHSYERFTRLDELPECEIPVWDIPSAQSSFFDRNYNP